MELYQVDAFTSQKYAGNPAGISLVDEFPSEKEMQNIAMEMNISETAFVKYIQDNTYEIRYFTPSAEVDLCGHATLASAHILFSLELTRSDTVHFRAKGGDLYITQGDNGYTMDFPLWDYVLIDDIENAQTLTGIKNIQSVYNSSSKWKVIIVESKQEVIHVKPQFGSMKGTQYGNIVVTCKGDDTYDYYMRCFVTDCDINEDPVTGSVECLLAPFWSEKLAKKELKSFQCSLRGGEKYMKFKDDRVLISGKAVTVFKISTL